jgi:hypothetical protein
VRIRLAIFLLLAVFAPPAGARSPTDVMVRSALREATVSLDTGCSGAIAEHPQLIATALHCVKKADRSVYVRLSNGEKRRAWIVATDEVADQAVLGDGHAAQGDAEVCGSGLETSMDVAFRFGLVKGKAIEWPRLEDATHIMVAGSARPLSDALRIAFVDLIGWLEADYGFARADAYQLVSQVAEVRVAQMVDPVYTVVAKFPKRLLPAPVARPVAAP